MLQHDYGSGNMQVNNATFGDIDGDGYETTLDYQYSVDFHIVKSRGYDHCS